MFDHVRLEVEDLEGSKGFYAAVLAPLGSSPAMEGEDWVAFGPEGGVGPYIVISSRGQPPARGVHVALSATDAEQVRAFHRAALEAGGSNNGDPGLRPDYHSGYFAAFVLDLDGNNIEAVVHLDQSDVAAPAG